MPADCLPPRRVHHVCQSATVALPVYVLPAFILPLQLSTQFVRTTQYACKFPPARTRAAPHMMGRRSGSSGGGRRRNNGVAGASGSRARPARRGDGRRPHRVGELIRREMASIVDDAFAAMPEYGGEAPCLVSVVDVQCSDDLHNARVNVSVLGTEVQKKTALSWLKKNRRALRFELAQAMSAMKYVPELTFGESEVAQAVRTVHILDRLAEEREAKAAQRGAVVDGLEAESHSSVPGQDGFDLDALAENPFVGDNEFSGEGPNDDDDFELEVLDLDDEEDQDENGAERLSAKGHRDMVDEQRDRKIADVDDDGTEFEIMEDSQVISSLFKTIPKQFPDR